MKVCVQVLAVLAVSVIASAATVDPVYLSAQKKMDLLDSGRAKRGTLVSLSPVELNAWVRTRTPQVVAGMREPRIELGAGTLKGYALVDLIQMMKAQGSPVSPMFAPMVAGEHPVMISVHLESAPGKCTVFLDEVQFSGTALSGGLLNFLIKAFFEPMFPDAKIDRPFQLKEPMERLDIRADGVRVLMKK